MKKDAWSSGFFDRDWWVVESTDEVCATLPNGFTEWRIEVSDHQAIDVACDLDFRLVETVVEFETLVRPTSAWNQAIRPAEESDIPSILDITDKCFTFNPDFYNRFKNTRYFSHKQMQQYFYQSVMSCFGSENSSAVVFQPEEKVLGYYMCREISMNRFKGVMTGVLDEARGKQIHAEMQQAAVNNIGRPLTLVNSTQLSNQNTINSHFRNQRAISRVTHIFYRCDFAATA